MFKLRPVLALLLVSASIPLWSQQVFGPNLIVNGDADAGPGSIDDTQVASIPGWTNKGANVILYSTAYGLDTGSIVPVNVGKNYFSSGKANSTLTQTVSLAAGAAAIDLGTTVFTLSGYFGGFSDHDDYSTLTVTYLGASNNSLGSVTIGTVKSADRAGTGLYFRRQIGLVPAGTRSATVTLSFTLAVANSNNNAYADLLSMVLNTPAAPETLLGRNLIVNGDAEAGLPIPLGQQISADIPGWVRTATFSTEAYANQDADIRVTDPGPADRGKLYFYGGPSDEFTSGYQDIDVSPLSSSIDSGTTKFTFAAWLGGYSDQEDNAVLTATFQDWAGKTLGTSQLGPVTATDRGMISAILPRNSAGTVPAGTRKMQVRMNMTRVTGLNNDGLADSLTLVLTTTGAAPSISAGGIATAAAYGGSTQIAPGTWIEIYGNNLAPGAREWAGKDFVGSSAPSVLDGVRVTIGGQNSYVRYISPGQVNVQVPSGVGTGQQSVVVSTSTGSSAAYPITVNATQPGFLAPSSFQIGGKQYIAALFADGTTFVVPTSAIPGIISRAATPGQTVILYGVGFGPTSPNIVAGQIVSQSNTLSNALQIKIGGTVAQTTYSGLSPNFVGLYQFNVVIPAVAPNDAAPLTATLGGIPVAQTLYIAVGK
jgi:uncharacterized protein (TIGR03437 family)